MTENTNPIPAPVEPVVGCEPDGWHDFTVDQAVEYIAAMKREHPGDWTGLGRCAEQMTAEVVRMIDLSKKPDGRFVRIPTSADEAVLMIMLGMQYLEQFAPHRLKASNPKADPAAVVGGSASSELLDSASSTGATV